MRIRKRWPPPLSVSPPPDAISSTPQPPHRNLTAQLDQRRPVPQLVKVSPINGSDAKKTFSLDRRDSNQNQEPPTGASSVSSSFSRSPGDEEERCRRSNGKKWRCWRRPLEVFSQCKYHLDQARLRKNGCIPNIGSRNIINHCKPKKVEIISSYFEDDDDDDDDYRKKKKKMVGFVKARSISSILSRTLPFRPATL